MKDRPQKDKKIYIDRELSWLQFNGRVLEEAEDQATPPLERLRFLSIFMSNLDEFYRVRVGLLCEQMMLGEDGGAEPAPDSVPAGKTAKRIKNIWKAVKAMLPRFDGAYARLMDVLEPFGVCQINCRTEVSKEDRAFLWNLFQHRIAPVMAPLIIKKKSPFPFFENGQLIVAAALRSKGGNDRLGLIPLPLRTGSAPGSIDRVIPLPSEAGKFMLAEDLILMFADKIFHKFHVQEKAVFSIIRNADIDENEGLYDYDTDLRHTVNKIVERRDILAPVKVKYSGEEAPALIAWLAKALYLKKRQIFRYGTPLDFGFLPEMEKKLKKNLREQLCYPPHTPMKNPDIDERGGLIGQILKKDLLLSYPFEDISAMIALLDQAAADERVNAIHITLYRVAHKSRILSALTRAAKNGKSVTCVIELRARFDEENNIDWAGRLQDAGCRVMYGMPGYKIHAKLLLIELAGGGRISLVGTGNFNENTARVYTDLSLLTAHEGIAADVAGMFAAIEAGTLVEQAEHLLVAPLLMKQRIAGMIDGEIEKSRQGMPAEITIKCNSLTERELIDKLIEASQTGVRIRLIVRGICCLIPGVPGKTDNITVRSIVGRFLEHSRIFVFGAGPGKRYYISSADLMTRNMTERVEAAVPVYDRAAKAKLRRILELNLADNTKARVLGPDGRYEKVSGARVRRVRDSQAELTVDS